MIHDTNILSKREALLAALIQLSGDSRIIDKMIDDINTSIITMITYGESVICLSYKPTLFNKIFLRYVIRLNSNSESGFQRFTINTPNINIENPKEYILEIWQ